MSRRLSASFFASFILACSPALAAEAPAVKVTTANGVPECATPGRLAAYVRSRNAGMDDRFQPVATEYMRHGEELGVRWDFAFFQMMVETGNLSFKRGNGQWGDVKPKQNNFAGLGATGGGEPGESFADVTTGVKAHLQHLLLYAGERVEAPVAERTRKVQEWKVLDGWRRTVKGDVTFRDLTKKWSPGDGGYWRDIQAVADRFYTEFCKKADPNPEQVALARKGRPGQAETRTAEAADKPSGAELARQAIERGRGESQPRWGLGASQAARAAADAAAATAAAAAAAEPPAKARPPVTIINPSSPPTADATRETTPAETRTAAATPPQTAPVTPPPVAKPDVKAEKPKAPQKPTTVQPASAAAATAAAKPAPLPPATPPVASACKVWTASYGGQRAVIIKSVADRSINYTVLDVNEGTEKREADAYIAAYARGGQILEEFDNQSAALDKAFDLCPEG